MEWRETRGAESDLSSAPWRSFMLQASRLLAFKLSTLLTTVIRTLSPLPIPNVNQLMPMRQLLANPPGWFLGLENCTSYAFLYSVLHCVSFSHQCCLSKSDFACLTDRLLFPFLCFTQRVCQTFLRLDLRGVKAGWLMPYLHHLTQHNAVFGCPSGSWHISPLVVFLTCCC